MTPVRSYWWVGAPYALGGIAAIVWSAQRAEFSWTVVWLVAIGAVVARLDRWARYVSPRVMWSQGDVYLTAALVLAPVGAAPFVGGLIGLLMGPLGDGWSTETRGKAATNGGQLSIAWATAGLTFETLSPAVVEPSLGLAAVAVGALTVYQLVNLGLVGVAVRVIFNRTTKNRIPRIVALFAPRTLGVALPVALLASTVAVAGPAFTSIALAMAFTLVAVPTGMDRLAAKRSEMLKVARGALSMHQPGPNDDVPRLVERVRTAGQLLGLTSDQLFQLEYVSLLYAATESFAANPPVSWDAEFRGHDPDNRATLITGLLIDDLADAEVGRLVDVAAILHSELMESGVRVSEIDLKDVDGRLLDAVAGSTHIGPLLMSVMQSHPDSLLKKPLMWLERRRPSTRNRAPVGEYPP